MEPLPGKKSYIMGALVLPVIGYLVAKGYIDDQMAEGLKYLVGGAVLVVLRLAIGKRGA